MVSCGMSAVGLDEILIAYNFYEEDDFSVPLEVVRRVSFLTLSHHFVFESFVYFQRSK